MNRFAKVLLQDRYLWLLAVPAIVYYFLFHYLPMYGLVIAFKDFSPFLGILRSPWAGFVWFEQFFTSIHFVRTVRNTLLLNLYGFFFNFTVPIIFALLLNEVHNRVFRRWVQTISYIPHFVSIVVVVDRGRDLHLRVPARHHRRRLQLRRGGRPVQLGDQPDADPARQPHQQATHGDQPVVSDS